MSQQTREIVELKSEVARLSRELSRLPVRTGTGASSPPPQLFHAVIIEACNSSCSTYRIQLVHRYLRDLCAECDGSGGGSGSGG